MWKRDSEFYKKEIIRRNIQMISTSCKIVLSPNTVLPFIVLQWGKLWSNYNTLGVGITNCG